MDAGLNGGERWVRSELLRLRAVEDLRGGYAQARLTCSNRRLRLRVSRAPSYWPGGRHRRWLVGITASR